MFCTKCGSSLPDDAGFCSNCGAPALDIGEVQSATTEVYGEGNFGGDGVQTEDISQEAETQAQHNEYSQPSYESPNSYNQQNVNTQPVYEQPQYTYSNSQNNYAQSVKKSKPNLLLVVVSFLGIFATLVSTCSIFLFGAILPRIASSSVEGFILTYNRIMGLLTLAAPGLAGIPNRIASAYYQFGRGYNSELSTVIGIMTLVLELLVLIFFVIGLIKAFKPKKGGYFISIGIMFFVSNIIGISISFLTSFILAVRGGYSYSVTDFINISYILSFVSLIFPILYIVGGLMIRKREKMKA